MTDLIISLYEAGLIQYGRFADGTGTRPFQHQLGMLASYPVLLRETARQLSGLVEGVDRLLCAEATAPLATAVALETGIPLVIARGDYRDGARDLVGAFDIGHPAALIELALDSFPIALVSHARRFGLEVNFACALLEITPAALPIPAHALFRLADVTAQLVLSKRLPAGYANQITSRS